MSKHELRFKVAGKAQGLDRSRTASNGHRFDSEKNRTNKAIIRMKAERAAEDEGEILPLKCDGRGYSICLFVTVKPPKSYTKKRLRAIEMGKEHPTSKPDLDNVEKLFLDGLKGILEDDRMVTSLTSRKRYGEADETECLILWNEGEEDE